MSEYATRENTAAEMLMALADMVPAENRAYVLSCNDRLEREKHEQSENFNRAYSELERKYEKQKTIIDALVAYADMPRRM